MQIVVLSNVSAAQAEPRMRNLKDQGFDFPLLINSGAKGPAVSRLARDAGRPVFFVDDIPQHHASVAEASPDVFRIHLIGDERLKLLLPVTPHAHLRAQTWRDAHSFIRARLAEAR